ncbi:MAG: prepilin-type N-terminal cleavage/methylation domain-containing protein [Planctomycetes bacterium]|nr:prepilin-type N-terminal cleavage/methylation domain-containing protein [Planctomycetota bacterium]
MTSFSPRRLKIRAGFTLLEAICALAIAALVIGATLGVLRFTVRAIEQAGGRMRQARVAWGIARVLRRDFEGAFAAGGEGAPALVALPVGLREGGASLEFTTTSSFTARANDPGLYRVEYELRPSRKNPDVRRLIRTETPYVVGRELDPSEARSAVETLAEGIVLWRVECYDGTIWRDSWRGDHLPVALRIGISLRGEERAAALPQTFYFCALVNPDADPMPPPVEGIETPGD